MTHNTSLHSHVNSKPISAEGSFLLCSLHYEWKFQDTLVRYNDSVIRSFMYTINLTRHVIKTSLIKVLSWAKNGLTASQQRFALIYIFYLTSLLHKNIRYGRVLFWITMFVVEVHFSKWGSSSAHTWLQFLRILTCRRIIMESARGRYSWESSLNVVANNFYLFIGLTRGWYINWKGSFINVKMIRRSLTSFCFEVDASRKCIADFNGIRKAKLLIVEYL